MRSGESALMKQLELRGNQIYEEGARKQLGERESWEKGKYQEECSEKRMIENGKKKALDIIDKKETDQQEEWEDNERNGIDIALGGKGNVKRHEETGIEGERVMEEGENENSGIWAE